MTDPEIERLIRLRRFLHGKLRRQLSGCLVYTGKKQGPSHGNPLLSIRVQGRTSTRALRRWIWEYHNKSRLPSGRYIVMKCGNSYCHAIEHMMIGSRFRPYTNNLLIAKPELFSEKNIHLIRYFKGLIGSTVIASWFGIGFQHVYQIWNLRIFSEVSQPNKFVPPLFWQEKAERASFASKTGHYLTENNRAMALHDIQASSMPRHAKQRLILFVQGVSHIKIAKQQDRSRETIHDSIYVHLHKLYKQMPDRKWIRLLLKKNIN